MRRGPGNSFSHNQRSSWCRMRPASPPWSLLFGILAWVYRLTWYHTGVIALGSHATQYAGREALKSAAPTTGRGGLLAQLFRTRRVHESMYAVILFG
jgi:hypothetical protein